jgi:hypothetical protein
VSIAFDSAKSFFRDEQTRGAPPTAHVAVTPAFDVAADLSRSSQRDDSIKFVEDRCTNNSIGRPKRMSINVS